MQRLLVFLLATGCLLNPYTPSSDAGDPFLDAVVSFDRPSGSHDDATPESEILGPPSNPALSIDTPEVIVCAFIDNVVIDGPGADVRISENVGGDSDVNIYGSEDGIEFVFLTRTDTDASLDLANYPINTLKYIRIEGLQNGGSTPGYELQGATALNSMDVDICGSGFHVTEVVSFDRPDGSHDDGAPLSAIIGPPDLQAISIDSPEVLTLGFGGTKIVDGPGPDFYVYELGNGDSSVSFYGSENGIDFEFLATTDGSIGVDLSSTNLSSLRFIRIEGLADGGSVPGYDLDSIAAINFDCSTVVEIGADSFAFSEGILFNGTKFGLQESDDVDLAGVRDNASIDSVVQLDIKGTSPSEMPTSFKFTFESSVFARTQVTQTISLFNFDADKFEVMNIREASRFTDSVVTVTSTGDLSRFVEAGTGCVEARIRFESINPRQVFTANCDFGGWTISF